jgi:hypothetical protein
MKKFKKFLTESYYSEFDSKSKSSKKYPVQAYGNGAPAPMAPKQPEAGNIGNTRQPNDAEQARIAERTRRFPHLGPGYHSHEEHLAALDANPNADFMQEHDITPDTIHLATPHEIESAHQSLSIVVDSYDGDPLPKDVEKLEFLGKHLR